MANKSGKAYALTIMSPIINGVAGDLSCAQETLKRCINIRVHEGSPFASVPNTYLARLFVLDNVYYESMSGLPKYDHLKSKYLVFSSNFHGDLDTYLGDLWDNFNYTDFFDVQRDVRYIWAHCVAFDKVQSKDAFIEYMKKCQLTAALFFNGSNDDSLAEQLKSLYLKQEFTRFAIEHQGVNAEQLQADFRAFVERVQPDDLSGPAWRPGQSSL